MKAELVLDEFRRRVDDTKAPYLWTDDEALLYLNKAHADFIRLTGGIRDARSELCELSIGIAEEYVELDPRILRVVTARVADSYTLEVVGPQHDYALDKRQPGKLVALVQGDDEGALRCVRIPEQAYTVQLTIERLPLAPLTAQNDLEVRDEYAYDLVLGMMAHAYTKQDAETKDERKAERYRNDFEMAAAKAYSEKRRRSGRAQAVSYGGL